MGILDGITIIYQREESGWGLWLKMGSVTPPSIKIASGEVHLGLEPTSSAMVTGASTIDNEYHLEIRRDEE